MRGQDDEGEPQPSTPRAAEPPLAAARERLAVVAELLNERDRDEEWRALRAYTPGLWSREAGMLPVLTERTHQPPHGKGDLPDEAATLLFAARRLHDLYLRTRDS